MLVDIAVFAPVLAGLALLVRSRVAVPLFAVGLAAVLVANLYELTAGTSRALLNPATMIVTAAIVVIAILQLWYSNTLRTRTTLR